jgi:ketosteroid isomerase-like protein
VIIGGLRSGGPRLQTQPLEVHILKVGSHGLETVAGVTGAVYVDHRPATDQTGGQHHMVGLVGGQFGAVDLLAPHLLLQRIDRIAGLYAEQGIILTPQGGALAGREQIRASLARNLAEGQPSLRLINARYDGGADAGVVIWVWEPEVPAQTPPAQRRRVRSMLYVKNSPAGWHIVADMFQVFAAAPG